MRIYLVLQNKMKTGIVVQANCHTAYVSMWGIWYIAVLSKVQRKPKIDPNRQEMYKHKYICDTFGMSCI